MGSPENIYSDTPDYIDIIYEQLDNRKPSREIFQKASGGYKNISEEYNLNPDKPFLTIIDFNLPSNKRRLWVIDLNNHKILYHTYVAHGRNSGVLYANSFSNRKGSYQSSLGFYITGKTYFGRNGFSMHLEGLEKDFNNRARDRAIVMHGAWYATEKFINKHGRLGRSYGCPAVPTRIHKELINTIANKTVLFIYYSDNHYLQSSLYLSK